MVHMGTIEQIFIAPDKAGEVQSVESVEAITDAGLKGDRYANAENRDDVSNQVTFIEAEQIERFIAETGLSMEPHQPRRNIVTRGVDLNALLGKRFRVGDCEFEGIELCEPCSSWAKQTHREVLRFFVHRGGLNARVIKGGTIQLGSPITVDG